MSLVAAHPSPHHQLSLSVHTERSQSPTHKAPQTPTAARKTLPENGELIVEVFLREMKSIKQATKRFHEIEAEHNKCCLWRKAGKPITILSIGLFTLGFFGESISGILSYVAEKNNASIAYMVAAIAGGIMTGAGSLLSDLLSSTKEFLKDIKEQSQIKEAHESHIRELMASFLLFIQGHQMDKMEVFKKCLMHLTALPSGSGIDSNTREELITSMLAYLQKDPDNLLINRLKEITALAKTLSSDPPAEVKGERKSPEGHQLQGQSQTPPEVHHQLSAQSQIPTVVPSRVVFHCGPGDMDFASNDPPRLPVGAGRKSLTPQSRDSEQNKSNSQHSLVTDLLTLLYQLKLKYIRLLGKVIVFPCEILGPYISQDSVRIDIGKPANQ